MALPARGSVKLSDVAALAAVAPMTVSRVLNAPELVSAATTQRVRAAIARLGYVPNLIAGGLSSRRTRMVAAIVPTMAHPMFAELVQSFTDTLRAGGYQVMLSLSGYQEAGDDGMGGADEATLLRAMLARRPDALLLTGAAHAAATRQMLARAAIPVVEIFDVTRRPIDMLVGVDHAAVGTAVAEYFRARGHDRFAVFAAADRRARARGAAFATAARQGGGTVVAETVIAAPSTIAAGRAALCALLPALRRRTALFCSSDVVAFGALVEARRHGLAVPEQLAVCGFGAFELSAASEPPFTTVSVEGARIGDHAARFLLERLVAADGVPIGGVPIGGMPVGGTPVGGTPSGDAPISTRADGRVGTRRILVPFRIIERASS